MTMDVRGKGPMADADRRAGVFYDKVTNWPEGMRALRAILLESPLVETFKWRGPCYAWEGRNLVIPAGLPDFFAASFLKGVLLTDTAGMLVPPGPNSRSARYMRFHSLEELEDRRGDLLAYIDEAIALEKAGAKVDLPPDDFDLPEELAERLDEDADLRTAWDALTPGRRRGYVVTLTGAKKPETRRKRIDKWIPRIMDGLGIHDR